MADTVTLYHPDSGTEVKVSPGRAEVLKARGYTGAPKRANVPAKAPAKAPNGDRRGPGRPPHAPKE